MRLGSVGPVDGPLASHVAVDLLSQTGAADLVVVPGASHGGPDDLSGPVVDALIRCEREAMPTVLLAATVDDLTTPAAAVCRDVASDDPDVVAEARRRFGDDRTHRLPRARFRKAARWLRALARVVA